jgi:hypothetical protein
LNPNYDLKNCSVKNLYGPLSIILRFQLSNDEQVKLIDFEQECLKLKPHFKDQAGSWENAYHLLQKAHLLSKNKIRQNIEKYLLQDPTQSLTRNQIIDQLEAIKLEQDLFFQLQIVHTWIKLGNKGLARTLIKEMLKKSPHFWHEHAIGAYLNEEEKKTIKNNAIVHIKTIKDQLEPEYIELLLLYFDQFVSKDLFAHLSSVKSVDYSANKIRELASRYNFGIGYPSVWYQQFIKRTKVVEGVQFINDSFQKLTEDDRLSFIWLMVFHLPQDEQSRNSLKKYVLENIKVINNYSKQEQIILLLENAKIVGFLEEEKIQIPPVFSLKKKHYTQCLKQSSSFNLFGHCLLQLHLLGVESMDFLVEKIE